MATVINMLDGIQRLRYDVYCLERHFEDRTRFPDGREKDEYDDHSVHLAATDPQRGVVATVRLVLDSPLGFPLESYTEDLSPEFSTLPRERTAEISRLVVAKRYRHLESDGIDYPLLFGLFRQIHEMSVDLGLEYLLAVMERKLWRLARRFGFEFEQIGDPLQHRGERIPCVADVEALWVGHQRVVALQGIDPDAPLRAYDYQALIAA